jgi:hypothetical protein
MIVLMYIIVKAIIILFVFNRIETSLLCIQIPQIPKGIKRSMDHGCMSKYNIKIDTNSVILILHVKLIINTLKKKWDPL